MSTPKLWVGAKFLLRFALVVLIRLVLWGGLLWVAWLSAGSVLQLPKTDPSNADAVIVLGGGEFRYQRGRDLVLAGYADLLMISHATAAQLADAERYNRRFQVATDKRSDSTWSEAVSMRAWMEGSGVRRALVVTDPPHILRTFYTWKSVLRGSGVEFDLVATSPPWWSAWHWWENEYAAMFAGIEVLKLGYYLVRYRFGFWPQEGEG